MLSSFRQLIDGDNAKKMPHSSLGLQSQEGNLLHRCRFSVNAVVPDEESKAADFSFLKIYNTKTGATRDVNSKNDKPRANEKLCIYMQLVCKDTSTFHTGEFVKIQVMQDSEDGFFKGLNPADLMAAGKKGADAHTRFSCALRTLTRFNVHLEAMVKVHMLDNNKQRMFVLNKDT